MQSASPTAAGERVSGGSFRLTLTVGIVAIAGLGLFWWQFLVLWLIWTNDSLRSIGAAAIPCSIALLFYSLDRQDFEGEGSWWGLVLVVIALAGANFQYYGIVVFTWTPAHLPVGVLQTGLLLLLYAAGVILLFGRPGTLYKARYALFLLLFVKPVPTFFTDRIDLPLQQIGATVAREFAALVGVSVTGPTLRLMFFHDELGMFVAPGCNGLRSASAMGFLALVVGAFRQMRLIPYALFVAAAVGLAYVFNLLRLCSLVLYYCLAHRLPVLGEYAVGADYAIGAVLFALAAMFVFLVPQRWNSQ